MKRAILFGAGAEIGSNLLSQNKPDRDSFEITDVVTHIPIGDAEFSSVSQLRQLENRILLADPGLLGRLASDESRSQIVINGRRIKVHFADLADECVADFRGFDLAIVATSRRHIMDSSILERLGQIANIVVGVAENGDLPAYYAPLGGADMSLVAASEEPFAGFGAYSLGSCQCVGWAAQLRGIIEAGVLAGVGDLGLLRIEADIVHPDTSSSVFGTSGIGARSEDPRGNLRPGFSQLQSSMCRIPRVSGLNTVSLRILTMPPGYQICRFFVRSSLDFDAVRAGLIRAAAILPNLIQVADIPVGSRAFSQSGAAATVLIAGTHLRVTKNVFYGTGITEIITQAYVHNTVGYCNSVLQAGKDFLENPGNVRLLAPVKGPNEFRP